IDRTVVNVDASVTNQGASAMEVLEKSPGIIVDKDGNISLKGKDGVMVMIDGRPAQLGGADLANHLRNLNASQLDQIEIMTNPPAKYDAAGNAGIINIKTKKIKTAGFNGSLSLGYTQGRYPKTNEGFNFNYRQGKFNLFANISHGYRKNFETMTIKRNILQNSTREVQNYFDQTSRLIIDGNGYNNRVGVDYLASKNTSFGIAINQSLSDGVRLNRNQTNIANAAKDLQSITKAVVENRNDTKNYGVNFNFRTQFDSGGKELTAEADYVTYDAANTQFMENSYYTANNIILAKADSLQGNLPQGVKIYSGRLDYYHPLKEGAKFEAGVKSSLIKTDNNAVYDSLQYGQSIRDTRRSNHFLYEENINAAYLNLAGPLSKKLNAQLGLRLENTNMKGKQLTTGEQFNRQYTQVFPTAFLQYTINEKNNLGLNYGRRISRPGYSSLNPFIRFIDRYTYSVGNPDLIPQTSHNIELSHSYKNKITTTFNYSNTTDIIQGVIEQKGQEAYSKPSNIASMSQFGLAVSINNNLAKWWTNNLNINVFRNNYTGVIDNTPIDFAATRLMINGTQQFKLSKTLTGELNGGYRSAGLEGVYRIQSMGTLAAGFSQQLFNNKGSIRLTVRDIFYTMKAKATINYGNVDARLSEVRETRVVSIGFSYRFSKGKIPAQKKRAAGSANEEQDRIGGN
ncbi:MAG: TonB-dependent receptor, partial [Chitinophagaceae bacterium]